MVLFSPIFGYADAFFGRLGSLSFRLAIGRDFRRESEVPNNEDTAFGTFVGLGWEVFEMLVNDVIAQNPFDFKDTSSDIFADLLGGFCAMLIFAFMAEKTAKITFCGGTGSVTGSNFCLRLMAKKF